jgi:hypothetical protein
VTPILVPLAWWRNRTTDPGTPEPGEPPLPPFARPALLTAGAFRSAVALEWVMLARTSPRSLPLRA